MSTTLQPRPTPRPNRHGRVGLHAAVWGYGPRWRSLDVQTDARQPHHPLVATAAGCSCGWKPERHERDGERCPYRPPTEKPAVSSSGLLGQYTFGDRRPTSASAPRRAPNRGALARLLDAGGRDKPPDNAALEATATSVTTPTPAPAPSRRPRYVEQDAEWRAFTSTTMGADADDAPAGPSAVPQQRPVDLVAEGRCRQNAAALDDGQKKRGLEAEVARMARQLRRQQRQHVLLRQQVKLAEHTHQNQLRQIMRSNAERMVEAHRALQRAVTVAGLSAVGNTGTGRRGARRAQREYEQQARLHTARLAAMDGADAVLWDLEPATAGGAASTFLASTMAGGDDFCLTIMPDGSSQRQRLGSSGGGPHPQPCPRLCKCPAHPSAPCDVENYLAQPEADGTGSSSARGRPPLLSSPDALRQWHGQWVGGNNTGPCASPATDGSDAYFLGDAFGFDDDLWRD